MTYEETGTLIQGVGGLYEVTLDQGETPLSGKTVSARAKGNFRHAGLSPLVGDRVRLLFDESAIAGDTGGGGAVIAEILPRRNALIRPPIANLDVLFVTMAAAQPAPVLATVDKLLSIAEHNGISPVVVVGKCDLDRDNAEKIKNIYTLAGYPVFLLSATNRDGTEALGAYLSEEMAGKIAAFAGASGVGKSTLLNALFGGLSLETGDISHRIERGKHTTRRVRLYPMPEVKGALIADTPGFSMLDFVRFDFFGKDELPSTMREFAPHLGLCRYTKCSHVKEEGCAILEAVKNGEIAPSRHESFVEMLTALKQKHDWRAK